MNRAARHLASAMSEKIAGYVARLAKGETMTRRELAGRQKGYQSELRGWSAMPWISLLILVFVPFGIAIRLGSASAPDWIALLLMFLGSSAVMTWAWLGDVRMRRLQRTYQVLCPRCGKALIGVTGELALTTGRCGGCGNVIVTDDTSEPMKVEKER